MVKTELGLWGWATVAGGVYPEADTERVKGARYLMGVITYERVQGGIRI